MLSNSRGWIGRIELSEEKSDSAVCAMNQLLWNKSQVWVRLGGGPVRIHRPISFNGRDT